MSYRSELAMMRPWRGMGASATPSTPDMSFSLSDPDVAAAAAVAAIMSATATQLRSPIAAIRDFQAAYGHGLAVDGRYGPNTRAALVTVTGRTDLPATGSSSSSSSSTTSTTMTPPTSSSTLTDLLTPPGAPGSGMPLWPFAVAAVAVAGLGAWFMLSGPKKPVSKNRSRRVRRNAGRRAKAEVDLTEDIGSAEDMRRLGKIWAKRRDEADFKRLAHAAGYSARAVNAYIKLTNWIQAINKRVVSRMSRNPRPREFTPVPGLSEWQRYAGGTAAREGAYGYDYKRPDWVTELHISPGRRGYNLQTFALPGHGSWMDHGSFKTPHMAAAYARRLVSRTGVQERRAA